MLTKNQNKFSSKACQIAHLGNLRRHKKIDDSTGLAMYLTDEFNAEYDLTYIGKENEFGLTELFGSIGGILVYNQNPKVRAKMFESNYEATRSIDPTTLQPKYPTPYIPLKEHYETVVILPGSNMLKETIESNILDMLVMNGAYVKPHPLTNAEDMLMLRIKVGDRLLTKYDDAYEIIKRCSLLCIPPTSELALVAKLLGKQVMVISKPVSDKVYTPFYENMDRIHQLVNTPAYGLFLPNEDWGEQIKLFRENYERSKS